MLDQSKSRHNSPAMASPPHNRRLLLLDHARVLQHVGPLAAGPGVAVLEVLPEVVGPVELLARVALAELVHVLEVPDARLPVRVGDVPPSPSPSAGRRGGGGGMSSRARELLAAIPTHVGVAGTRGAVVEGALVARQRGARPAVPPNVEGVLVALGLVLVLEAVAAEGAFELLFGFVGAVLWRI